MKRTLSAMCGLSILSLIGFVFPSIIFAQSNDAATLDGPMPSQGGPTPYNGPAQSTDWGNPVSVSPYKDCGGKSSSEAQVLSLPSQLASCRLPVGELRWFSVSAEGSKYLIVVRAGENAYSSIAYYSLTVRNDVSSVNPVHDPHNLFIKLEPGTNSSCDLYVYDGNNPSRLIQSSTRSGTSVEELEIPLVTASGSAASSATNVCDQTAKSIVTASGGCSNIDSTVYKNVYNACCTLVTKVSLLQLLNDALADGVLSKAEKLSLLGALDRYLSETPTANASAHTSSSSGDTATESFRDSCRSISDNGTTIQAECQRIDTSWVQASYRHVGCSTDITNIDGTLTCSSGGSGGGSTCTSDQGTLSLSMNSGSFVVVGGYTLTSSGRYPFTGGYSYSCFGFGPTGQQHQCNSVSIKSCQTTNMLIKWSQ